MDQIIRFAKQLKRRLGRKMPLRIIGITGTNGKGTTAFMIKHILETEGYKVAIISSIKYYDGERTEKADYTTPPTERLKEIIGRIRKQKCDFLVMEVSSHGIKLERIKGISFDARVFTNFGREHLEFHHTLRDYKKTKSRFILEGIKLKQKVIVNINDNIGKSIAKKGEDWIVKTGFKKNSDVKGHIREMGWEGSSFDIEYKGEKATVRSYFTGRFNIENALCAAGTCLSYGIKLKNISRALSTFRGVDGRFEVILNKPYTVVIDDAHNAPAFRAILQNARNLPHKKIVVVFGAGGVYDPGKRELIGRYAARYTDLAIVTDDNPRHEDPQKIRKKIIEGIKKEGGAFYDVSEREGAIKKAISLAEEEDCILIVGKGHESEQIYKDKIVPFNDKEVATRLLREMGVISPSS